MITYNWQVTQMQIENIVNYPDYVVIVSYVIIGTEGETTYTYSNQITFSTENVSNFIDYNSLTNEIVIGWVKEAIGLYVITEIEKAILDAIYYINNPPIVPVIAELPWTPYININEFEEQIIL